MSYTRVSDNLYDSSLWSDDTYEGVCTLKLWIAILGEARTSSGRFRRLTPAKAARIGAIPLDMAATAIERLTGPDPDDSSGVAEGRRLVRDPDGQPNDYVVANWQAYGREFDRAGKTARQRRWRQNRSAASTEPSTDRLHVDGDETQEEKERRREEKKNLLSDSDESNGAHVPADLKAAADFWNGTLAPAWEKPRVQARTVGALAKKYRSVREHMLPDFADWSLEAAVRKAFADLPGLRDQSWFRFKEFFFAHDFLQKNEKLWTGFYASTCGRPKLRAVEERRPEGLQGVVI